MLNWDKTDFIECLEVLPDEDGYGTWLQFVVEKSASSLCVSVFPYESILNLDILHPDGSALTSFTIYVRGKIELRKEKGSEFLLIDEANFGPNATFCHHNQCGATFEVHIGIKPNIFIRFV